MMEGSPTTTISPLLLRNILTSIFIFADKPLEFFAEKHKLLQFIRSFLISSFLFFLSLLPSLIPSVENFNNYSDHILKTRKDNTGSGGGGGCFSGGDSGVARALSQLLSLVNDIPVNSRKYEVVRSLAEKLIDENVEKDNEKLRGINRGVLSSAFMRTLSRLEAAILDVNNVYVNNEQKGTSSVYYNRLSWFLRVVGYYVEILWKGKKPVSGVGSSAEKLAAEALWLARKMSACGCVDEAVSKWASATHLAWLALSVDQRLQSSLVKVSAFLFMQIEDIGREESDEVENAEHSRMKMRMLMSWLPLLCRGSNGTDAPVLSMKERAEMEKTLEDIIETLGQEVEQEKVLSLWLHHYTQSASSDWPNLQECYTRWYNASRQLLLKQL